MSDCIAMFLLYCFILALGFCSPYPFVPSLAIINQLNVKYMFLPRLMTSTNTAGGEGFHFFSTRNFRTHIELTDSIGENFIVNPTWEGGGLI